MAIGTPVFLGQQASGGSAGVINITTGAAVPAGARVFFVAAWVQPNADYWENSFTDASGLTFARDFIFNATAADPSGAEFLSAPCPGGLASGETFATVFANGAGTIWGVLGMMFYVTGLATSSYMDASAAFKVISGNPGNNAWTSNAVTTTNADDLLVVCNFSDGTTGGVGATVTAPFAEIGDVFDSNNGWRMNVGYRIVSSTGTYSASGTHDNNPGFQQHQSLVAYEADSGAPPPPAPSLFVNAAPRLR